MFRNMVTSLIVHESIHTTDVKAKELRRVAERLVTLGKKGGLASRRRAASFVRDKEAVRKLFDELAERFSQREGGYTRIIKLGRRQGDNAPISQIEFLGADEKPRKKKKKEKAPAGEPEQPKAEETAEESVSAEKAEPAEPEAAPESVGEAKAEGEAASEAAPSDQTPSEEPSKETTSESSPETAPEKSAGEKKKKAKGEAEKKEGPEE